jgi:hypothetical protein
MVRDTKLDAAMVVAMKVVILVALDIVDMGL